jgi:hypothetical protein
MKPIHVKLNEKDERDVTIHDFLEDKPKSFFVKEAILFYMKHYNKLNESGPAVDQPKESTNNPLRRL